MKLSNESKIGALTAIAVSFLILGFNFLKGRSVFKTGNFLYAKYSDTKKLMPSNPVYINGYQVGTVYDIGVGDNSLTSIVVTMKLNSNYNIPDNSVAEIESSPLGTPAIVIATGNSSNYLKTEDTINTRNSGSLLGDLSAKLAPVADQLQGTLASLDSVLRNFNTILNPNTKNNLQGVIGNLNKATASILVTSASLESMLNQQTGALAQTLGNVNRFTKNLDSNGEDISKTISNLEKTTERFSKADVDGAVNSLKASADKLDSVMNKINASKGTLGALVNDKEIYDNLNNTIRSLNILMDDLRAHPKRYVSVSVFGKKDKGNYLTEPLKDSSATPSK